MGPGGRAFAGTVLALLFLGLIGVIGLQAVPPPATSVATAAASASATSPTASPTAAAANTGGAGTTINATEKDFAIALDKSSVPAGNVTFKITNQGPSLHTLGVTKPSDSSKAAGITGPVIKDSGNIDTGQTATETVSLAPGTYNVVCAIPGHVQLGMILILTVT